MKRIKKDSSALKVFWCVLLGCSLFVLCFSLLEKAKADEYLYTGAWSYHANDNTKNFCPAIVPMVSSNEIAIKIGKYSIQPAYMMMGTNVHILSLRTNF